MKITPERLHSSNVLLATCDDVRILQSEVSELVKGLVETNWIKAPTPQELLTHKKLVERYNSKITDLLCTSQK